MRLTVVACGAPLAARTGDLVDALSAAGWSVAVVVSAAGRDWTDHPPVNITVGPTR